jgi:O-antigen/teichoic acid export membrane protein
MLRIGSNFLRLGLNFLIGIVLVRLLLRHDLETYAIYALIVVGIGIGAMLKELARIAIVPRLGKAFGSDDQTGFARAYASSFVVSAGLGAIGAAILLALIPLLPAFSIAEERWTDTSGFLAFRAAQAFLIVFLAPMLNLLLLARKFVLANILLVAERAIELASILLLVNGVVIVGEGGLTQIAIAGFAGLLALYAIVGIALMARNNAFRPRISAITRDDIQSALKLFGWTAVLVLAMNLFLRFDLVYVNVALGTTATALFALAVQATGMMQQITNGIVGGIDANAAHAMQKEGGRERLVGSLLGLSRQQSAIAGAIGIFLILLAPQLLKLWLGEDALSAQQFAIAAWVIRIMLVGILVRGLAEVWMYALNGMGHVGAYSRWLLVAALCNPALVLLAAISFAGEQLVAIAAIFTVLHILAYAIAIPLVASRILEFEARRIVKAVAAPVLALIAIGAGLALAFEYWPIEAWPWRFAISAIALAPIPLVVAGGALLKRFNR